MSRSSMLRRKALQKIALLSAEDTQQPDLTKLYDACPPRPDPTDPSLSDEPLGSSELDVLLALCDAAPLLQGLEHAQRLFTQLRPYLLEAHVQILTPSSFLLSNVPLPWELLNHKLTFALLAIGINHPALHERVFDCLTEYLQRCLKYVNSDAPAAFYHHESSETRELLHTAAVSVSLLGFLDATSSFAQFFTTPESFRLLNLVRQILDESFLVTVEGAFSSIRTSDTSSEALSAWALYARQYAASGRPLGAMLLQRGFMKLSVSCTSLLVSTVERLQTTDILDDLMSFEDYSFDVSSEGKTALLELICEITTESMRLLEDGLDYLQLGSSWQQQLAFDVKAQTLRAFLVCTVIDEEIADIDILMSWLEDTMADPIQMADEFLACVVLRSMAVLGKNSPSIASTLSRSLPRFLVQGAMYGDIAVVAAQSLTYILQLLSQDAVITGLYSLGNVLSARSGMDKATNGSEALINGSDSSKPTGGYTQHTVGSTISVDLSGEEDNAIVYGNIVRAIVSMANSCQDDKITALAQSMLVQKLGRLSLAVDLHIVTEAAKLATSGGPQELQSLLKLYTRLVHDALVRGNETLANSIKDARLLIAESLEHGSQLYPLYLTHLLETIVSKGDIHESDNSHQADVDLAAREILSMLPALAALVSQGAHQVNISTDKDTLHLHREAWFNMIVHGIIPGSSYAQDCDTELRALAMSSRPLIAEDRADQYESEIELNTVLRRGMNPPHTTQQKKQLISLLPHCEEDIRSLSYPKVIFLNAAYFVETLRAGAGDCSHILSYFRDSNVNGSGMENCMNAIANEVISVYLRWIVNERLTNHLATSIAEQLAAMFIGCCNRISSVQQVAASCASKIIHYMPSALCQKSSLFALLELLTIMWTSCLDAELDEYETKVNYTSIKGKVSVELSHDYALRKNTLNSLYKRAKHWVTSVINVAPSDIQGLLQTYLSDYDDDGVYGHISLGRSFALEMGSVVSSSDQKLGAIDIHGDYSINTASDFMTQYTTRQEYRYMDSKPRSSHRWSKSPLLANGISDSASDESSSKFEQSILGDLETRKPGPNDVLSEEIRESLKRAAAFVCRSEQCSCAIVQHLVRIPFACFTKQSIKLGISLWMSCINENPWLESRFLMLIAEGWEKTVHRHLGVFSKALCHRDPFYTKEEFAPSAKWELTRQQQKDYNLIAPHLRLLQFLFSHFSANRLGSIYSHRTYYRLAQVTLKALKHSYGHPLAREFHFYAILFGLSILRYCTSLEQASRWRLKDDILSAALAWFAQPPRWSFGGNRLQIKAELRLLANVDSSLRAVASQFTQTGGTFQALNLKQDLVFLLLDDEQARLIVWLYPLDHERRHMFFSRETSRAPSDEALASLLPTAWVEGPELAVRLTTRLPSPTLSHDVRKLLLKKPQSAIQVPDALHLLLGDSLPEDVTLQRRYLLYWDPVNPVTAVVYFLPGYRNDPFIMQYAVSALESHAVDVTFFYVPQIVQTLRYDVLGYVQRYIIETAKFSQLFAHQIIWNMTANAYKDEDSSVEDSLKPTLDVVKDRMIASFSATDKAFFEREFSFFNEITDISGKLRPYIKKSKPEKKQKIEEELRKIQVEVGVYLPSNPEGTVVGIDRKSGKPLQSHAKAPYMATFRIKKNQGGMEGTEELLEKTNEPGEITRNGPTTHESTYEVWQSAIFKVGDDCRQDVLALQMIAAFRGIFNSVGLDVYVYPYRVTATAPGCGVIDVLPNSISRDMLGREAVNGLYDYFVSKYGAETSIRFQEARNNFVKSMAAYSVISYLLQFKDRHNGNIMIDDAGHILHIDFGFCFDIAPGGVRFERAPFKLTSEMVAVMGGSTTSQSYQWFEELSIKAFLASRQHTEKLCHIVQLMLGSGLPCFKPETIAHLRERFVLEKSEREAADFMRDLVKKSYSSYSTKGYDQFQLLTNGIPY